MGFDCQCIKLSISVSGYLVYNNYNDDYVTNIILTCSGSQ